MKKQIKFLMKQLRFKLSASNSFFFIGFYKYFYKPKEGSLSHLLDMFSKHHKDDFTVVQIGANDGITHDPIHKFIKRDKWKGVLLEPQSKVFKEKLQPLYSRDKQIVTLNSALGEVDGETHLYKIGFSEARWATGLASFNKSHLESAFESGHVLKQAGKEGIDIPADPSKHIISERVEVVSPASIMKNHQIETLHLLQIDAEGFDFEVVKLFKIEESKPKMVCFESTHLSVDEYAACIDHFESRNYQVKKAGANTVAMLHPLGKYTWFFN